MLTSDMDEKDKRIATLEADLASANRIVNAVNNQLDNIQESFDRRLEAAMIAAIGITLTNTKRRNVVISTGDISFFNPDCIEREVVKDAPDTIKYTLRKDA